MAAAEAPAAPPPAAESPSDAGFDPSLRLALPRRQSNDRKSRGSLGKAMSDQEKRDINAFIDSILAEDEDDYDGLSNSVPGATPLPSERPGSAVPIPSGRVSPGASQRWGRRDGSPGFASSRGRYSDAAALSASGPVSGRYALDASYGGYSGSEGEGCSTARALADGRLKVLCCVPGEERMQVFLTRREGLTYGKFKCQVLRKVQKTAGDLYYMEDGEQVALDDDDALDAFVESSQTKLKVYIVPHESAASSRTPSAVNTPTKEVSRQFGTGGSPPAPGARPEECEFITISKSAQERLGVTWHEHTVLRSVQEGTPAAREGCQRFLGRRVVSVNGRAVTTLADIRAAVEGQCMVTLAFSGASAVPASAMLTARQRPVDQLNPELTRTGVCQTSKQLCGHRGAVYGCAVSADGAFSVSVGKDKTVRIWITATGQNAQTLIGHSDVGLCCDVSRDGRNIVSGGGDNKAMIWSRGSGGSVFSLSHQLVGHTNRVYDAKFSPDSTVVATASCDCNIRLWAVDTGACSAVLQGHTEGVLALGFGEAAGSRLLASGSDDKLVRLWDWQQRKAECVLPPGHNRTVWSCRFSFDDTLLVTAALSPEILVWDVSKRAVIRKLLGHQEAAVHRVIFCSRRRLLSCARDHKLVLWDLAAPEDKAKVCELQGHTNVVYCVASSNGVVVSSSADQTSRVWDVKMPAAEM